MPIKIAVCDDAKEDIELLSSALLAYDPTFEIVAYTNGNTLVDDFLDCSPSVDILFLDIYMPGIDGIKTAREIRSKFKDIIIIFLSSSKDHYSQAYEVFAFNYILKPFDRERLYTVLARAIEEIHKQSGHKICFSYKSTVHTVNCRDIQYLESVNRLLLFHLADASAPQCYGKLDEIIKKLPERLFIRCHQSFIVNASAVTEMGENYFRVGQVVIGISKRYLKPAKDQYYTYLFTHLDGRRH